MEQTESQSSDLRNENLECTSVSSKLFWEPVAARRWGQYISAIELEAIQFALRQSATPTHALEIGAEGGRWSKILAHDGWQITCTDIDETALAVCQSRIPSANCILVNKNSTHFPCETNTVGMLLAIEVHEILEQDWFVLEAQRTLVDRGLFVGVFQNKQSWRGLLRNLKQDRDGFKHYTASYKSWRSFMRKQGFEMLKEVGLCWMPFGRMSNSRLIPLAVCVEKWLGLRRIPTISPWIVFVARKDRPANAEPMGRR